MDINHLLYDMNEVHNVVWRISGLPDFQRILSSFLDKAEKSGVPVCYIHFSDHQLVTPGFNRQIEELPLTYHFESFSTAVYHTISRQKNHTFFIFDSLSDLQTAWATDLMMENFFRVMTPMIRRKKGKAFFPLIRRMHSGEACEEIMEDTEIFLDLYSDFKDLYLRPRKVFRPVVWSDAWLTSDENVTGSRSAFHLTGLPEDSSDRDAAFFSGKPYVFSEEKNRFIPLSGGDEATRYLATASSQSFTGDNKDAWERFFDRTLRLFQTGRDVKTECRRMAEIMMSRDPKIRALLEKHFTPIDYFSVEEHMVGTGLIGGKACGMLLARKIIENCRPDIYNRLEAHDSFFIGSDVFYSYIVDNHYWQLRVRQRTEEGYFSLADDFAARLRSGTFSRKLEKEFIRILEYYGNCPIIVRSSSILEDGFDNAFAGKYDSVFCMGTGTLSERLQEFEDAIRIVYASTMSRSALDYRLRRGLNNRDEQMALLVMRVSGSFYGQYYLPCAAGVGYSYSTYRFLKELDPSAGMLRLVMGLGTTAVDRTEGSYPRLVSLDRPEATSFKTQAEHHRFSQRRLEAINTGTSRLEKITPETIGHLLPSGKKKLLFEHDRQAERAFMDRGIRRDIVFVSCQGLVKDTALMTAIREMMQTIQKEYEHPVDIEFTLNTDVNGSVMVNLLQCRPLLVFQDNASQCIPDHISDEHILLDIQKASMGHSQMADIDLIVFVDPVAYFNMPYKEKPAVASAIGRINWLMRGKGKKLLLFAPGRLGTSSPELGVPTSFSDISEFTAVFEMAESGAGYNPELSYGSHMFQDLVENAILYGAVFENKKTRLFNPDLLSSLDNSLSLLDPSGDVPESILKVYDVSQSSCRLYHDMMHEHLLLTFNEKEGENSDDI